MLPARVATGQASREKVREKSDQGSQGKVREFFSKVREF